MTVGLAVTKSPGLARLARYPSLQTETSEPKRSVDQPSVRLATSDWRKYLSSNDLREVSCKFVPCSFAQLARTLQNPLPSSRQYSVPSASASHLWGIRPPNPPRQSPFILSNTETWDIASSGCLSRGHVGYSTSPVMSAFCNSRVPARVLPGAQLSSAPRSKVAPEVWR